MNRLKGRCVLFFFPPLLTCVIHYRMKALYTPTYWELHWEPHWEPVSSVSPMLATFEHLTCELSAA